MWDRENEGNTGTTEEKLRNSGGECGSEMLYAWKPTISSIVNNDKYMH